MQDTMYSKSILVSLFVVVSYNVVMAKVEKKQDHDVWNLLHDIKLDFAHKLEETKAEFSAETYKQEQVVAELRQEVEDLKHSRTNALNRPNELSNSTLALLAEKRAERNISLRYQYSEYGCRNYNLYLSCSQGTIALTGAEYGYYDDYCYGSCCAPHPTDDCTALVQDVDPQAWISLIAACEGQTSCNYEYQGAVVPYCANIATVSGVTGSIPGDIFANYMEVFYNCFPMSEEDTIGFTVQLAGYPYFYTGDVVEFPYTITNVGGTFDTSSHVFRCPFHGLYLFTVTLTSDYSDEFRASLLKDGSVLIDIWADYVSGGYNQAGNTVVEECFPGEILWVECTYSGYLYGYEHSTFTGVLIKRMD